MRRINNLIQKQTLGKLFFITCLVFTLLYPQHGFTAKFIEINIPALELSSKDNEKIVKVYKISVGRSKELMTPIGDFKVLFKQINPGWIHPKTSQKVPPGQSNPLGPRLIVFHNIGDQLMAIHGTNEPSSIGKFVSHGCIRMNNKDVEELYNFIEQEETVKIRYERLKWETKENKLLLTIYPDPYKTETLNLDLISTLAKIKYKNFTINQLALSDLYLKSLKQAPIQAEIGLLQPTRKLKQN